MNVCMDTQMSNKRLNFVQISDKHQYVSRCLTSVWTSSDYLDGYADVQKSVRMGG